MAAKKVDPLKAKEAKQKKIAIGGIVVLLLLLGVQGPKTLKMLKGPQAAAPAAASATPPAAAAPAAPAPAGTETPGGAAAGETPAAAAPELASVADSDPAPVIEAGQLATFERFASKDPFVQQAKAVKAPAGSGELAASDGTGAAADGKGPDGSNPAPGSGGATTTGGPGGFTTGGSTPAPPAAPAAATSIAVNGGAEDVKVEATFPATQPTFVLVSLAADGKSVEIGIAGGAYADGDETLKLTLGKKITLRNTADGSSYELELLTVEGFAPPKTKK